MWRARPGAPPFRKNAVPAFVARIGMSKRATAVCILAIAAVSCSAAAANGVLGSAKNVVLDAAVTRKRMPLAGGALRAKTELVLRNIRFEAHPGTQFNVILERSDDPARRVRVGMLSFYMPANAPVTTSRTFDVSEELREIGTAGLESVNVVFEATTGRGGANANARVDARSKLTVGEIELRVKAK